MSDTTEQSPPIIEFPCIYPIKIVGLASDTFIEQATQIVHDHDEHFDPNTIGLHYSKNDKYVSIRCTIYATGKEQLHNLFEALKATGQVQMVL